MKQQNALYLPLALVAWLLTGRAAVSLSSLKSDMNDHALQKEQLINQEVASARNIPGAAGAVVSLAQLDADLMAISEEAEALAESPSTSARAAIGAWRVAVHAAWLALPVDADSLDAAAAARTLALAEKGMQACNAVDTEKSFTNPRDCALIGFAPAQVAFQVSWERYKHLADQSEPQGNAFYRDAEKLFREYENSVWDKAWIEGGQAKAYGGLDASVAQYIDDETFLFMCAALVRFQSLNRVAPESGAEVDRDEAARAYRNLRQALADRLALSVEELRSQKTRECTTRLSTLGMGS